MLDLKKIASVAIYPPIGVARVGNSPDEYFLGPRIPGQAVSDPDDFRDAEGRIKRQAVKFYIYALDEAGNVLGELTEKDGVKIDWRVDVANKKAAWYDFDLALDIPSAEGIYDDNGIYVKNPSKRKPVKSKRRNIEFECDDRKLLMIEARAQRITGCDTNAEGGKYQLKGKIGRKQESVYLGEVRTDEAGRLIFLGGHGHSAPFTDPAKELITFANNDGWYDDTSDGPVDATVSFPDGSAFEALGAWVAVAPPNFAVGVQAFSTGYELLADTLKEQFPSLRKDKPSFYADIYPTLQQIQLNQWVNAGVSRDYGWGSPADFEDPLLVERLKDPSNRHQALRQSIFNRLRNPDYKVMQPAAYPPLYGDAVTMNINSTNPRNWFAITELKYEYLRQWAAGDFIVDKPLEVKKWEDLNPSEQANALIEAPLEETLGGPFHPGCEFTWPMRHPMLYSDKHPFRIKRRSNQKENFGVFLDAKKALATGGPLDGASPGDITKWMAIPWQTDTSSCLSAYKTFSGEYLPTFWPARVPNDVLTEKDFNTIQSSEEVGERIAAFGPSSRKKWLRGYVYNEQGQHLPDRKGSIKKFTAEWGKIGIVLEKDLGVESELFPSKVWVETGRSLDEKAQKMLLTSKTEEKLERPEWVDKNPRLFR